MPTGKIASQVGHAYVNAYLKATETRPDIAAYYQREGIGTKVCLVASSEFRLLRAYEDAMKAGLPCSLIIDQHHILPPHFDGNPIVTALGIGPVRKHEVHHITKRFGLL